MLCQCRTQLSQLEDILSSIDTFSKMHSYEFFPLIDSFALGSQGMEQNDELFPTLRIQGLKYFEDCIKTDIRMLHLHIKQVGKSSEGHLPPSTNAPYLIAVWNELVACPTQVTAICATYSATPRHANISEQTARHHVKPNGKPTELQTKVDVVSCAGLEWTRINTVKNSRLLAEFREQDSYLTDSDSDCDISEELRPHRDNCGVQHERNNSLLRMGRTLVSAASANPLRHDDDARAPTITLRLTRLRLPDAALSTLTQAGLTIIRGARPSLDGDDDEYDPRIAETLHTLLRLGLRIELGERPFASLLNAKPNVEHFSNPIPTTRVNLDLSVLIALVSDITHASLPNSVEEAKQRFIPDDEEKERMQKRKEEREVKRLLEKPKPVTTAPGIKQTGMSRCGTPRPEERTEEDTEQQQLSEHSRALTTQLIQEMKLGLLEELRQRFINAHQSLSSVEFWTTAEARERCLRIVEKIGGEREKTRAAALFRPKSEDSEDWDAFDTSSKEFWSNSRYPKDYLPIVPVRIHNSFKDDPHSIHVPEKSPECEQAWALLERTCIRLLNSPSSAAVSSPSLGDEHEREFQRSPTTRSNKRLTAHTVDSLFQGVQRRWTTVSANRASVKEIGREVARGRLNGLTSAPSGTLQAPAENRNSRHEDMAVLWIVAPRSLAEGMRGMNNDGRLKR